jgi:Flp pilus assembly protein TadD
VKAEPGTAWHVHTLGLAHYRAGQFDQAVRRLQESTGLTPAWEADVDNWLVLALAQHRLDKGAEARRWLDRAVEWSNQRSRPPAGGTAAAKPLHPHDELARRLLLREAEALLKAGQ